VIVGEFIVFDNTKDSFYKNTYSDEIPCHASTSLSIRTEWQSVL